MSFSSNMYNVGLRLLTKYGQSVTFVRDNTTTYNPADGTASGAAAGNYSGVGYPESYNSYLIDETVIKQQDIKLTLSSVEIPLVNDIFTLDGVKYTAQNVEKITAQGSNIISIVQLRQ